MTIYRAICEGLQFGQQVNNVLHIQLTGAAEPAGATQVANTVKDHWITEVRNGQSSSVLWTGVSVYALIDPMPSPVHILFSLGGLETSTPQQTPAYSSLLLRIRTGLAGRQGRGRLYIPGVHNGWHLNGGIHTVCQTNWTTRITNLVAKWSASGSLPEILGVAPRSDPSQFKAMTSLELAPTFGVQRRRGLGIGV